MPELPDIEVYRHCLTQRIVGRQIIHVRIQSPFVVRSFDPPIEAIEGKTVLEIARIGKRIVLGMDEEFYLILHLMIAGRLRWSDAGAKIGGKITLATFAFPNGTLSFTEAASKKRASLHLVRGRDAVLSHDPSGLEPLTMTSVAFAAALRAENHTLKRTLTDPHIFAGIGNAYSDEILHAARLSPVAMTSRLSDEQIERLYHAVQTTLAHWCDVLRREFAEKFPGTGDITAFRDEFAVHGRFGKPCRVCGTSVQRIRYADRETNYCPRCQTDGKLLADRSLSLLLRRDWPKSIDEWEAGASRAAE